MTVELDELYFTWLYGQVADPRLVRKTQTYWDLLRILHKTEFYSVIPMDDNRVEDGKDLRYEFVNESGLQDVDLGWIHLGCSMLELFVGLSRRLAFIADKGEANDWFWVMMVNLDFDRFTDRYPPPNNYVEHRLYAIINREYWADGQGGIFPLKNPPRDQRDTELWYQLQYFVMERDN